MIYVDMDKDIVIVLNDRAYWLTDWKGDVALLDSVEESGAYFQRWLDEMVRLA